MSHEMNAPAAARQWLRYAPDLVPGTRLTPPGAPGLFAADPERFFVGLLGERMNAAMVFVALHGAAGSMPAETLQAVDDALANAYWDTYQGVLTPPPILRLLRYGAEGPSGAALLGMLDDVRLDMFDTEEMDGAADVHADARVQFLLAGAHEELTDAQVAIGEILTDYLLLQRAIAWDVRQAEQDRGPGEPRCAAVDRLDKSSRFSFERAITQIMQTKRVLDRISPAERPLVEAFARRRRQLAQSGVIASLAGT